ncbi:MAG: DUF4190 domain-containing protein [Armatimonadetes bacterium]|nr:DUF4190 domain-containing protein [Armatimonadota bacterium]
MYCTYCGSQNDDSNFRCTQCHRVIQYTQDKTIMDAPPNESKKKYLIPVDVSSLAMMAGYMGLFSIFLLPAPISLLIGILAIYDLERNPGKNGKGRAIFGIVMGAVGTVFLVLVVLWLIGDQYHYDWSK